MRTQSPDTSPAFEQIQIAHIRTFSAARKFRSVCSWTQSLTSANFSAIDDPSSPHQERDRAIQFVTREYGNELASLFRNELAQRAAWSLHMLDLQAALLPVIKRCEQRNVRYLLTGSLASSVYGLPRLARDVDLLVDLHPEQFSSFFEPLAHSYLWVRHTEDRAQQYQPCFSLLHVSCLVKLDVFLPFTAFDVSLLQRGQALPLIEGRAPLWMIAPEESVLMQLRWYRHSGANADDQWNDVLGVLKVQASTIDLTSLGQQAEDWQVHDLLRLALIDAGIRNAEKEE